MYKRNIQAAAAVLALVMLTALFTACSQSTSSSSESSASSESSTSSASSEEESSSDTESEESSDVSSEESDASSEDEGIVEAVAGEITSIADGSLELYIYDVYPETTDFTDLTGETLTATGETETITLDAGAAYEAVTDGVAEAITQDGLLVGDMVAVTTAEDGSQTVIVLEYDPDADDTDEADDTISSDVTESEAVEEAAGE